MILIPNYNGSAFISQCVSNFIKFFPDNEIIVVDDYSSDNSVEVISQLDCKLIVREKNGGFASAVNTGLRYFLKSDSDWVIVSNSDINIDRASSDNVIKAIDKYFNESKPGALGFLESNVKYQNIPTGENISGFFFVLSKEAVLGTGFFDEEYYMYGEEQDYFRRLLNNGFTISQSSVVIDHTKEGSAKAVNLNSWLAIRNSIYLELKNRNLIRATLKIFSLFLIINRLRNNNQNDPSNTRLRRIGIIRGNLFLIKAILWNLRRILINHT